MKAQLEIVQRRNAARVSCNEILNEVVVEGLHPEYDDRVVVGRYYGQCPDIDGQILIVDWEDALGEGKWPEPGE
eukprot:2291184-Ditylum_brightwellii.AAC.1